MKVRPTCNICDKGEGHGLLKHIVCVGNILFVQSSRFPYTKYSIDTWCRDFPITYRLQVGSEQGF